MILVVADTTPLNYLILIDCEEVLAKLFTRVLIPPAILRELQDRGTPEVVRQWTAKLPAWLEVRPAQDLSAAALPASLGAGERESIALGAELHSDLLLVDDREARVEAGKHGLRISEPWGFWNARQNWDSCLCPTRLNVCVKRLSALLHHCWKMRFGAMPGNAGGSSSGGGEPQRPAARCR